MSVENFMIKTVIVIKTYHTLRLYTYFQVHIFFNFKYTQSMYNVNFLLRWKEFIEFISLRKIKYS